jgi:hypothetical protein
MTEDEMTIETLRYRAPTVVPLSGNRFAIIGGPICGPEDLHRALSTYIENNVLKPKRTGEQTIESLCANIGLTAEEFSEAISRAIAESRRRHTH